jgi:hypothetical protein
VILPRIAAFSAGPDHHFGGLRCPWRDPLANLNLVEGRFRLGHGSS